MNLFQNSILTMRRRSVWEAVDSGVLLWRKNFLFFIPFFVIPVLVFAFCLRLILANINSGNLVYLSYAFIWWLKPLFERPVLHVLSKSFFTAQEARGQIKFRRGLLETIFRSLLGDLSWRRFSPGRAALTPIRVLERAGGRHFRQRKQALAAGGVSFCTLTSAFGFILELMLLAGEVIFFVMITQIFFPTAFSYLSGNLHNIEVFIFAAFCLNYILVGSLYVCMGFGLYINSRVEVEGWDLQLLFQKFAGVKNSENKVHAKAQRRKEETEKKNYNLLPAIIPVFLVCFFMFFSTAVFAEDVPPGQFLPVPDEHSLQTLDEVLSSRDFGGTRESWGIRFRHELEAPERDIDLAPWAEMLRQIFAFLLRFIVVIAAAAFLIFVFYWLRKHRRGLFNRNGRSQDFAKSYAHPLLSAESPESLFDKSEMFFQKGLLREAWAACLSGCLGAYNKYHSVSFPIEATEYGCLALVNKELSNNGRDFEELVKNWVNFAYGERPPNEGAFESALTFGRSIGRTGETHEP